METVRDGIGVNGWSYGRPSQPPAGHKRICWSMAVDRLQLGGMTKDAAEVRARELLADPESGACGCLAQNRKGKRPR